MGNILYHQPARRDEHPGGAGHRRPGCFRIGGHRPVLRVLPRLERLPPQPHRRPEVGIVPVTGDTSLNPRLPWLLPFDARTCYLIICLHLPAGGGAAAPFSIPPPAPPPPPPR